MRRRVANAVMPSVGLVGAAGIFIAAVSAGQHVKVALRVSSGPTCGSVTWAAPLRPVVLITGDRVLVATPGPGRLNAVLPAAVTSLTIGGRSYVIPAAALPYLGRGLDLSLFELSALRRLERRGRLPVRVGFHGHRPALPGVRITRAGPRTAVGYLTARSARLFGAALDRHLVIFRSDAARGLPRPCDALMLPLFAARPASA